MRRYILILIIAISSTFTCPKPVDKESAARISALYYNRAQIWNSKTLAADNTNIATQIYTGYLTDNLEV
jgi:hypothetical protein